ncbi:N-hydroxyarylamine O-acetyltransferase [Staphylococcus lugdunensis]|uniref:N-acetyltransferase n=5 Tax=Staphylococcus TaxID=1279 RepID=A0ABD4EF04_STALU|nr:N-acetyltransferase [Staphylococcus lugdunensis M23590]KXA38000.1 N-acetyltransferase [Staphylococcus lugdunensis]SQE70623.1 N-hydroxyarylamine O-acetyltransferase [Staphylococcus lugdunensis]
MMNIRAFEHYMSIDSERYSEPSLEALNDYATRFMYTVPFENINVQNGIPISVDINDLYHKIVDNHRGGFCYELNTLFQAYLKAKGFDAQMMSATVHTANGGHRLEGSHVSLVVPLQGTYYVTDVGFGDLPLHAMPITLEQDSQPVQDISGTFRAIFENENKTRFFVQKWESDTWKTKYDAILKASSIDAFKDKINYNETHPDSIFVQNLLITQPKSYGRVTMSQQHLTVTKQNRKVQYDVTPQNYRQLLQDYFNLNVTIDRLELS